MMDGLSKTIRSLHSQPGDNSEPRKKTEGEKTVISFRKHEGFGDIARNSSSKLKKLLPQSADRSNSHIDEASPNDYPWNHSKVKDEQQWRHPQRSADQGGHDGKKRKREQSPVDTPAKCSRKSNLQDSGCNERKKGGDNGLKRKREDSRSEEEEVFESPSRSFESDLMYNALANVKNMKKQSHPPPWSSTLHSVQPQSSSSSSKNVAKSSKRPRPDSDSFSAMESPEKHREILEALSFKPNSKFLLSITVKPQPPQRRKTPALNDEEMTTYIGKRVNIKTAIYSGTKTSNVPKMTTTNEKWLRVLQNNIDSIGEVDNVPFEILKPVLERCTPKQLCRIEQKNQSFPEDLDGLWMSHCKRDFKHKTPQENESWRKMYWRLYDERQGKLNTVKSHITCEHVNKPNGRQVKLVDMLPPPDVFPQRGKFGARRSSAAPAAAAAPIKLKPASKCPLLSSKETAREKAVRIWGQNAAEVNGLRRITET